ncbi:hypothetical protein [Paraburkholderia atlantica]
MLSARDRAVRSPGLSSVSNESIGSAWHAGHGEKRPGSGTPQYAQ